MATLDKDARKFEDDTKSAVETPNFESIARVAGNLRSTEPEIAVAVRETKAGYKTTEFWLTVVGLIGTAVGAVPTPHDAKGYVLAALVAVYVVARGLAKNGVANVTPVAASDVVSPQS